MSEHERNAMPAEKKLEQFDFFTERDKLQAEIKDKLFVFLAKCGNSKVNLELNPKYISGIGKQDFKLIGLEFKIIIIS